MSVTAWSRVALLIVGLALVVAGCKKPPPPTTPTAAASKPTASAPIPTTPAPQPGTTVGGVVGGAGVGGAGMDVKRTAYKTEAATNLRTIAQLYLNEALVNNAPPDPKTFVQSLRQQATKGYNGIQDGFYIMVPNARAASGVVICYEKEADSTGIHFTAFGDGSVQKLTTQQLQAALQMK